VTQHHQASLLDPSDAPPTPAQETARSRTPWVFQDAPATVEQSTDRCPDCQAVLNIRERVGTMNWNLIYRLSKADHAPECVARNPSRTNIERAIQEAYARNEPLSVIQDLEQRRRPAKAA